MSACLSVGGHQKKVACPIGADERARAPNRVALLTRRADEPAEQVHAPAGRDGLVPDVGLAKCCPIGVPGDARPDLAPGRELAEFVTDDGPLSCRCRPGQQLGSAPGRRPA
jgi:hypothetical protein